MKKPNIIYMMADDHAANAISAYGSRLAEVFKTPNLDRIANEGCRMDKVYCSNNICTPSRATILTGQYSNVNGVKTLADYLDTNAITYPKLLKENGYQTAVFGKWHVHSEPQGFDDYNILPGQGVYFDPIFVKKGEGDWPKDHTGQGPEKDIYAKGKQYKGYVSDLIVDFCIEWLDNRDEEKPFMLMCHHKAPHDFFEYHPRDEHIFDGIEIPEPENLFEDKSHRSDGSRDFGTTVSDRNIRRNYIQMMTDPSYPTGQLDVTGLDSKERTKKAYQKYLKDYLRTVKSIDDNTGRLLKYLDDNGLAENTIIIYTSDQGMFLGEHDYIDKRWIFNEALQMPFVIRYPKAIKPGTVSNSVVGNVDFAPTLLDYAGVEVPEAMQGKSFRSILEGAEDEKRVAYNRYWMHMAHHDNPAHYGIITDRYKLIYFYGLPLDATGAIYYPTPEDWELYDLEKDPDEVKNVYNDPEYKDVIVDLKKQLKELKDKIGDQDTKYKEMLKLEKGIYCE